MSSHPVRTRRRAQAVVGVSAVLGLLAAGPALTAGAQNAKPVNAIQQLSAAAVAGVPSNVQLFQVNKSILGLHKWYRQMQNGYPVVGGLYATHATTSGPNKGQASVWDGRVKVGSLTSTKATVSAATAIKTAAAYTKGTPLTIVKPSLWVLPGATAKLVWQVTTVRTGGAHSTFVDAITGKVAKSFLESQSDTSGKYVDGKARVFDPNPVVKLQDEGLTDDNDSNSAVPKKGYSIRVLGNLDKSAHKLTGHWADVIQSKASSNDNKYMFMRADDKFEEVMDYYAIDTEQSYLQKLGIKGANDEAQKIQADAMADDNSWYIPSQDLIQTGTGGVDDAEDPEVVWHEGGHAIQDAQVPGWGQSEEAGAMGEGFGDYMAVTLGQEFGKDTALTPTTCVMDWDSVSYTPPPKHCLRTTDQNKMYPDDLDGEVHDDGEIWSQAIYEMSVALGRDDATTAILEAQFSMNPNINMPGAAKIIVSTTKQMYGAPAAKKATKAFKDRGIL